MSKINSITNTNNVNKISISTNELNKFIEKEYSSLEDLSTIICNFKWSHIIWENENRNEKSFKATNMVVLDIDNNLSLNDALEMFGKYKHIITTTKNHQQNKNGNICDRFRIVLFLEKQITNIFEYKNTMKSISIQYPFIDKACVDGARFWFPSNKIISIKHEGVLLNTFDVPVGSRHDSMLKIAGKMKRNNEDINNVYIINNKLSNPLPEKEIDGIVKYISEKSWVNDLLKNHNNKITNQYCNLVTIVENDELFSRLSYNEREQEIYLNDEIVNISNIRYHLSKNYAEFKTNDIKDALYQIASKNSFCPIQKYINNLKWDGIKRVDNLAICFGAENNEFNNTIVKKTLLAAVARTFKPGCLVKTILVLQGKQNLGKSKSVKALCEPQYYATTNITNVDKDTKAIYKNKWIIEYEEMAEMSKKDVNTIKTAISTQSDVYRIPYGEKNTDNPRRCIFIGTTNEKEILSDSTGNIRFLILPVTKNTNEKYLIENRDQIWAELYNIYNNSNGENLWWLSPEEEKIQIENNKESQIVDPWQSEVEDFLQRNPDKFKLEQIFNFINIEISKRTKHDRNRIAKILRFLGYENKVIRNKEKTEKIWVK